MALMKSGFKAENQDLIHGDFTEVNVTYWGVQREEKKEKENKNKKQQKKKCHLWNLEVTLHLSLERQQTP